MPDIVFREPQDGDAEAVARDIRPADQAEIDALLGPGQLLRTLQDGIRTSTMAWCVTAGGEPIALVGAAPINLLAGEGAPWFLGTSGVDRHHRAVIRAAPSYIARMLAVFPHLVNVVDARNTKAIAWLRRAGFVLYPAMPLGHAGLPFHPFTMDA